MLSSNHIDAMDHEQRDQEYMSHSVCIVGLVAQFFSTVLVHALYHNL